MDNLNQKKTIQQFANDLVKTLKNKVPKSSGNLAKSISADIDDTSVGIDALEYIKIVDKGISGKKNKRNTPFGFKNKKPPIKDLEGFAKKKGINVWALQKSIFNNGFKGKNFIEPTLDNEVDELADNMAAAVWDDFAASLK